MEKILNDKERVRLKEMMKFDVLRLLQNKIKYDLIRKKEQGGIKFLLEGNILGIEKSCFASCFIPGIDWDFRRNCLKDSLDYTEDFFIDRMQFRITTEFYKEVYND